MKTKITLLIFLFLIGMTACQTKKEDLKSDAEKRGYAIGISISKSLAYDKDNINIDLVMQGIRDGLDSTSLFTDQEVNQILQAYQTEVMQKDEAKRLAEDKANKIEGEKFLEENKTKEGVITLPSGLQYKVLKAGKGRSPKTNDKVSVHYAGRLVNGKEFGSSYKSKEPSEFIIGKGIKGWTEALLLMKTGDKWEVYIPDSLAYSDGSPTPKIPPFSTLIFEVELLDIVK